MSRSCLQRPKDVVFEGLGERVWLWWWWRKEEEDKDESFLEERVFRRECEFVKMKWVCAYVCVWP